MSSHISKLLQTLEFEPKEEEIYLQCIKKTRNTPTSLAKETGIQRTTVYFYLDRLIEKGLLTKRVSGKQKFYTAKNPEEALQQLVQDRTERAEKQQAAVEKIIPLIQELSVQSEYKSRTEQLEGKQALRDAMQRVLNAKSDYYWIGSVDFVLKHFEPEEVYKMFTLERMKGRTTAYQITDASIKKYPKFYDPIGSFRYYRILPKPLSTDAALSVFEDTIVIASSEKERIQITLVTDPAAASIAKLLFKTLWDALPSAE